MGPMAFFAMGRMQIVIQPRCTWTYLLHSHLPLSPGEADHQSRVLTPQRSGHRSATCVFCSSGCNAGAKGQATEYCLCFCR